MHFDLTNIERAVMHPGVRVQAGPWRADMQSLVLAGWRFQVEMDVRSYNIRVVGRNPSGDMVSVYSIHQDVYASKSLAVFPANTLYFDECFVITNREGIYGKIMAHPYINPVTVDVGVFDPSGNEFIIITAKDEDEPSEIIVSIDKIPSILASIRSVQEAGARELLHKQNRRDKMEMQKLKQEAKILSFG